MKVKCEFCGAMIDDTLEKCPNCGANNQNIRRTTDHTPKTIEELQQWYKDRSLPPYEVTRFFIGIDYKEPKAFGIYQDGTKFIVYKNKADGSRAIRYEGTDEAYAVNELFLKLKAEILDQKAKNTSRSGSRSTSSSVSSPAPKSSKLRSFYLGFLALLSLGLVAMIRYYFVFAIVLFALLTLVYHLISKGILNLYQKKTGHTPADYIKERPKRASWLLFDWVDVLDFGKPAMLLISISLLSFMSFLAIYNKPHYYAPSDRSGVFVSYHNDWYSYNEDYDDYDSISFDALPAEIQSHPADYEFDWTDGYWYSGYTAFTDSTTYEVNYADQYDWDSSSDSDSDYDWGSGDSWDSDNYDWDSDW